MKNVLIIGGSSQLGRELTRNFENAIVTYNTNEIEGGIKLDIANKTETESTVLSLNPDVIINTAAFVEVDSCEILKDKAYNINANAVRYLSRAASVLGAYFVHISTDYVFDGISGNYTEESVPNPINYYGFTKAMGDAFSLSYNRTLLIRTSGIFGSKNNFPGFALDKLQKGEELSVFQGTYSPISAKMLAKGIAKAVDLNLNGILNIAGQKLTRKELALRIASEFNLDPSLIKDVEQEKLNFKARRPLNTSLNIEKAKKYLSPEIFDIKNNLKTLSLRNSSSEKSGGGK